jgi:hypothetical protein
MANENRGGESAENAGASEVVSEVADRDDVEEKDHGRGDLPAPATEVSGNRDAQTAPPATVGGTAPIGGENLTRQLEDLRKVLDGANTKHLATQLGSIASWLHDLNALLASPTSDGRSENARRLKLTPARWSFVVLGVLLVSAGLFQIASGGASFALVSRALTDNALAVLLAAAVIGGMAGATSAASEKQASGAHVVSATLRGAGAAILAGFTVLGGAKAVEHFAIGSGPQVVFVGSGTVHRYLFGNAQGALNISADGTPLGPQRVRFWAFEGESPVGVNLASSAYNHHTQRSTENRVPLIAMASGDVLERTGNHVKWRGPTVGPYSSGEHYFRCLTRNTDSKYDDFAIIPLFVDLEPEWYVSPPNLAEGIDKLPALCRGDGAGSPVTAYLPNGIQKAQFHIPGGQSGTRGAVFYGGDPDGLLRSLGRDSASWHPVVVSNPAGFSLDLNQIKRQDGEVHVAIGNFALGTGAPDWKSVPCAACGKRDLTLLVPVEQEDGTWRPLPYVCLALQVLGQKKLGEPMEDFVDFDGCPARIPDPALCRCKLTRLGQGFLLDGTSEDDQRLDSSACSPLL